MKNLKNNNKGFSLVELIVVIAIMVVLVAVLAGVFTQYIERSKRSTDVSNAASMAESITIWYNDPMSDSTKVSSFPTTAATAATPTAADIETLTAVPVSQVDATKAFTAYFDKTANETVVLLDGYTLAGPGSEATGAGSKGKENYVKGK